MKMRGIISVLLCSLIGGVAFGDNPYTPLACMMGDGGNACDHLTLNIQNNTGSLLTMTLVGSGGFPEGYPTPPIYYTVDIPAGGSQPFAFWDTAVMTSQALMIYYGDEYNNTNYYYLVFALGDQLFYFAFYNDNNGPSYSRIPAISGRNVPLPEGTPFFLTGHGSSWANPFATASYYLWPDTGDDELGQGYIFNQYGNPDGRYNVSIKCLSSDTANLNDWAQSINLNLEVDNNANPKDVPYPASTTSSITPGSSGPSFSGGPGFYCTQL